MAFLVSVYIKSFEKNLAVYHFNLCKFCLTKNLCLVNLILPFLFRCYKFTIINLNKNKNTLITNYTLDNGSTETQHNILFKFFAINSKFLLAEK